MSRSCFIPRTSLAVFIVFSTQTVFGHVPELNVWKDRRKTVVSATQYAAVTPTLGEWPRTGVQSVSSVPAQRLLKPYPKNHTQDLVSLLPYVPTAFGSVSKITLPEAIPERTLLHVQDIHLNAEAQANIGNTVKALLESKKVDMVFLEGAFGPVAFDRYAKFPDQKAINKAADYLLKENRISGAVHALLSHALIAVPTVGVDDKTHYDANVETYRQAAPSQNQVREQLKALEKTLRDEKEKVFNSALKDFDHHVEAYRSAREKIGPYVQFLADAVGSPSSNTETFLEAWRAETTMDFALVEASRNRLVSDLANTLSKKEASQLLRLSVAYRLEEMTNVDFYQALDRLCQKAGVSLDRYPAMKAYVRYVFLSDAIEGEILFQDVAKMEKAGYATLAKTRIEKDLVAQSRWLHLALKLVDFSLTKMEWEEYKKAEIGNWKLDQGVISPFERFYAEAERRDVAMAENVLRAMDKNKARTAVLITGGFHAGGMQNLLKKSGVASITFTPKISKVEDETGSNYLSVLTQQKTPLDKLFEGETLFLPPHTAQLASVGLLAGIAQEGADPKAALTSSQRSALTQIGFPSGAVIADRDGNQVQVTLADRTQILATLTADEHRLIRHIRIAEQQVRQEKRTKRTENAVAGLILFALGSVAWYFAKPYWVAILWLGGLIYAALFVGLVAVIVASVWPTLNIDFKSNIARPTIEEIIFSGLPLLFAFGSVFPMWSESGSFFIYAIVRVIFVVWHVFDEGLPKNVKQLWERVFLPTIISLIAVGTYFTDPFYWALASHIVLNMFSEKIGDLFERFGIDFDPEKANLKPLVRMNGKTSRLAKPIRPHWESPFKLDGLPITTPGILIPKFAISRDVDEDGVMDLVLDPRPGGRVFVTENKAQMTYLTLYIMFQLMNRALRPYSLGLATGGTQDEVRRVMGMPGFARTALGSITPDFSRVVKWTTLDDYVWHPDQIKPGQDLDYRLSSYREEQFYMLLRNLYPHLSDREFSDYFVSPLPAPTKEWAANDWHQALKIFEKEANQILWQLGGIGTSSHFAFVETVLNVFRRTGHVQMDLFKILNVSLSEFKDVKLEYGAMSEDGLFPLLDITKVQNAGYWVPRSFHPFFLRFMGENRFGDIPSMLLLLSLMPFDEVNSKFKEEKFRFKNYEHFIEELKYLIGNFRKVPDFALSQGVAGVLRRTNHPDSFNITTVEGPHKAEALRQMLDVPPGPHSSAGLRHHLAAKSIVIVTDNSTGKINRRNTFQFVSANPNKDLFRADAVEEKWNQTPGGKTYQALMEKRRALSVLAMFLMIPLFSSAPLPAQSGSVPLPVNLAPEGWTLFVVGVMLVSLSLLVRHLWRTRHITPELMKTGDRILEMVTASINGSVDLGAREKNLYLGGIIPITELGVGGIDGRPYNGFFGLRGYQRRLVVGYVEKHLSSRTFKKLTLAEARRLVLWAHNENYDSLENLVPNANVGLDLNVQQPRDIPEAVATVRRVLSRMGGRSKLVLIGTSQDIQENWTNTLAARLGGDVVRERIVFLPRHRHSFFVATPEAPSALDAGAFLNAAQMAGVRNLVLAVKGEYVLDPVTRQTYVSSGVLANVAYIVDYLNDVMAFIVRDTLPVKHLDKLARAIARSA